MARGKKKESLTIEEKLEAALVPVGEQPYEVPRNWCWVKLKSLSEIISKGTTPRGGKSAYKEQGIDFLRVENIEDNGSINHDNIAKVSEEEHKGFLKRSILQKGDVLVSIAGTLGRTAIVKETDLPLNTNQAIAFVRLVSQEKIDLNYIKGAIDSPRIQESLLSKTKVTAIPNLTLEIIGDCCIPFPPLPEQHRIVERIESLFSQLDEARDKAQEALDGFSIRRQSYLHKAFIGKISQSWRSENKQNTDNLLNVIDADIKTIKKKRIKKVGNDAIISLAGKIPKEWAIVDLDRIAGKITDGEHSTPTRVDNYEGYYLLSARNVYDDDLRLDDVDYIDRSEFERIGKRCNPRKGDVLISCSGSVGRSCVIDDENNYCMVRSAAMISVVRCNPRFIMYMIQADEVQDQIKKLSKQTAQANLFLGAIAALYIPIPSIQEQNEIVRLLDDMLLKDNETKNNIANLITDIELTKKSILAKAFRGELGTNDPEDESAIELLKRVIGDSQDK